MAHQEFIREVPGSRHAVLLIHGILGTPDHFAPFLPLIPEDHSVYNILLDGHGGGVEDFSHTSMKKWKAQVTAWLDYILGRYDSVIIAAHSMGTLFAIREAVCRPGKIKALFLLQVPLYPRLKLKTAAMAVLLPFGVVPKGAQVMCGDSSVTLDPWLWKYIGWVPRFLELFGLCREVRAILGDLNVPCQAFQSRQDELVSNRSARELEKYPHIQTVVLPNSGHFGHSGEDLQLLQSAFAALFTKPAAK